jgi:hypothetical protein
LITRAFRAHEGFAKYALGFERVVRATSQPQVAGAGLSAAGDGDDVVVLEP